MMSKIVLISRVLDHFYPAPPIPLNHFDNFTLLVSVVLSAQTTDGKVNEVTQTLFEVAGTPQLMSAMAASDIQKIIQPVGLAPKKSVYLQKLSQKLIDDFSGEVPSTYESLESLPGVGHKTASVVMSQAFGESALAVDTHVHRLSLRWGLSADEKNVDKVQLDLHRQFPEEHWNKVHLQMIYFGREYCTAKLHVSKECPICSWVNKKGGEPSLSFEEFTPKKKSKGIVFYEDRITELIGSPHLARGAILMSPMKSAVKKILLDDIVLDSSIVTPAVKIRKPRALKLVAVKVKVEEKIKENGVIKIENTTDDVKDMGAQTPRAKRIKKDSVTESVHNLNFITPTLDREKPKRQPRKIKNLELELLPKSLKTEEISLKISNSEVSPSGMVTVKIEEKKLCLDTPIVKRSYKRKNGK